MLNWCVKAEFGTAPQVLEVSEQALEEFPLDSMLRTMSRKMDAASSNMLLTL